MNKRIVIAGGTGFIGKAISESYLAKGYEVVVLTRGKSTVKNDVNFQHWDGKTVGEWKVFLENAELLINLTGKSVNCRYTDENKALILSSRVEATKVLGEVIQQVNNPPKLWINASTATIYDYSLTKAMTEEDGDIGNDFSMSVATAWENAFYQSTTPKTRKVSLRISLVLGENEGVLPVLTKLSKLGLGGFHGNGKQKFAWIHIIDVLRIIEFVHQKQIEGPINCTTNSAITNKDFMKALRKSLKVPFGIPTPTFALKLGAIIMGTESELILKSRFVKPKKLLDNGFKFSFTDIDKALQDLK
jgi:uncharacterized protein